jgi:hypothetical protein
MIREFKAARKGSPRDAPMEKLSGLRLSLLATDDQEIWLRGDRKILLGEARDGNRDAILVLAKSLDIVGRPIVDSRRSQGVFEEIEHAIKADARTIEGCKIQSGSHDHILQ